MRSVTIHAPTYSELRSVYIARSLYVPETERLTPEEEYIISRRLAEGYNKFKDHPEVQKIFNGLKAYRETLKRLGLSDEQVLPVPLRITKFSPNSAQATITKQVRIRSQILQIAI